MMNSSTVSEFLSVSLGGTLRVIEQSKERKCGAREIIEVNVLACLQLTPV